MKREEFFKFCSDKFSTEPDYSFREDFDTAVLRHSESRKWYAICMRVSRSKFGQDSDEIVDVVNLKQPLDMFGFFGSDVGVYPAYHMNKLHWISVLLPDSPDEIVHFLTEKSFEITEKPKRKILHHIN